MAGIRSASEAEGATINLDDVGRARVENVRVITGSGEAFEDSTIHIQAGKIVGLGTDVAGGADLVIDGSGMTAIPGLIDAHGHLNGQRTWDPFRRYLEEPAELHLLRAARRALDLLRSGFTAVRDCGLSGQAVHLRRAIRSGIVEGPHVGTPARTLSETGGASDWPVLSTEVVAMLRPRGRTADGPWEFTRQVRENFREGATYTSFMLTRANLAIASAWPAREVVTDEELEAAVGATHALGGRFGAHCSGESSVRRALAAGVDVIDGGKVGPNREVLQMMADKDVTLVPTLSIYHLFSQRIDEGDPTIRQAATRAKSQLEEQMEMVALAREIGVRVAAGTDLGGQWTGVSQALEMELLVGCGFSAMEALTAGTLNGAVALGWEDLIGTIEIGKFADIVLVTGDPRENVSMLQSPEAIATVLHAGVSAV